VPVDVPSSADSPNSPSFRSLGLPRRLAKALARAEITTPTPVQRAVIPDAVAGRDVLGRAATGSGKTLAFGLPILARLAGTPSAPKSPRALILVPTRELANQVRVSLEPLARAMDLRITALYGGTPYDRQVKRLRAGVDVVVATPGRLRDLVSRGSCRLDRIEVTVLDEADHLCDLGFFPVVTELVGMTPRDGQRLLLSATLDGDVDRLVRNHLTDPVTHDCDPDEGRPDIAHHVLVTAHSEKVASVAALVRANPRSIVFTRTRNGAGRLAASLRELGVPSVELHGSLGQGARERSLRKFQTGQADVVVATDVAARGIHVDGVAVVVHYDVPQEHKSYLHRSGRTARAGSSGTVVTLATQRDIPSVLRLQRAAGVEARHHEMQTVRLPITARSLAEGGVPAADLPEAARREGKGGDARGGGRRGADRSRRTPQRPSRNAGHGRRSSRSGHGRPRHPAKAGQRQARG
jgi:superfamily II DNA/RNA helicase